MSVSPEDIIPLTQARAKLTELCEEVRSEGSEKIIAKNGERCAALIDAERLDHDHRLEREHIHLTLLEEAIRWTKEAGEGKTVSLKKLKSPRAGDFYFPFRPVQSLPFLRKTFL